MTKKLVTVDNTTEELPPGVKYSQGSELEKQLNSKLSTKQDAGEYITPEDPRLSDSRTPKTHTHHASEISNTTSTVDGPLASNLQEVLQYFSDSIDDLYSKIRLYHPPE